eukprot:CAMPEP_0173400624 /NCGR_PEP_ID=MMETSP1356-20130122/48498_1 /TAXON_ID=77927 ORGANISM="Hemiselmis virescens, Strain PCC157" /NCGR_SAMPLE_ID=MMETSP1356 /ASSEMBLY_ACC=CAM_ASM_000847 /LENGTH=38 /DNA_ID= /DNA_START= /DNA_END= /DNA_ORIENTATION=
MAASVVMATTRSFDLIMFLTRCSGSCVRPPQLPPGTGT